MGSYDGLPSLVAEFRTLKSRVSALERRTQHVVARGRRFAEETAEVSTTLTTPTDLGGPEITTNVPGGIAAAETTARDRKRSGSVENAAA